jgi:MYXO-CTERM domain-containing protein
MAEPSSVMMGATAALAGLGYWWLHRRRAVI